MNDGDIVTLTWNLTDLHPIHLAASRGKPEAVKLWVLSGVDIDVEDQCGLTALMCAAIGGHDVVKQLLSMNANLDIKNGCDDRITFRCIV